MSEVSIKTLVMKADKDWSRESVRPITYEFSNGRQFKVLERPGQAYQWMGTGT